MDQPVNIPAGWLPIGGAPTDQRIRVGHHMDPSSLRIDTIFSTYGKFNGRGWDCNSGFVCIDGMLRWQPTHWLPEAAQEKAA